MSFVPREQEWRVRQLALATDVLTQTAAHEVASAATSEREALVIGMMCHISRQLQVLLEATTGVIPNRVVEIAVIPDGEVN